MYENQIKLALWKNDKRDKPTQPYLKGGKPQDIGGQQYWVSAFFNIPKSADDATREKIEKMLDWMCKENGSYPLISISLSPAEQQGFQQRSEPATVRDAFDIQDNIPFAPIRGLML
jgi:hypothetical protein